MRTGHQVDQLARTSYFKFDDDGYLAEMTDPAGQVTSYTRNAAGLPEQVTVTAAGGGPAVADTEYTYDASYNIRSPDLS